uniref:RHD domain-containing protein n=1 Tax=Romanomermis culicivorax TaxID=13658 RepID=A0A915HPZ0_ROMCU
MRQKEKEIGEILSKKYIRNHESSGIEITDDVKEKCSEKAQREAATMKDCLHCVRLGFQAFIENPDTGLHIASAMVFSNPIYNSQNPGFSELRIAEIDRSSGSCIGGDTVWMRCATKVKR